MTTGTGGSPTLSREQCLRIGASLVIVVLSVVLLWLSSPGGVRIALCSAAVIAASAWHMGYLLWKSALRADVPGSVLSDTWYPHKRDAVIVVFCMLLSTTLAFGGIYHAIRDHGMPEACDQLRALYISATVLGLNDPSPKSRGAGCVVMAHYLVVILLFTCIFGILISRIADFKSTDQGSEQVQGATVTLEALDQLLSMKTEPFLKAISQLDPAQRTALFDDTAEAASAKAKAKEALVARLGI